MAGPDATPHEFSIETERLLLRTWHVSEASVQRQLWAERDLRVPARRRIDADGRPTGAETDRGELVEDHGTNLVHDDAALGRGPDVAEHLPSRCLAEASAGVR